MSTAVLSRSTIESNYRPIPTISTGRDFIASPSPELAALSRELAKLMALPTNWDRKGGVPVSHDAAFASLPVLQTGLDFGVIAHVMPLGDGSVLAEWQRDDRLLQIEWAADGSAEHNIAVDFELVSEGPLPSDVPGLFAFLLGVLRQR
jgi:hypothetical protein